MARKILILSMFLLLATPWQLATAQTSPLSPCSLTDIDKDNDRLIDICDLEGLDAIRYQPDGTGYRASASAEKITAGCPDIGCRGYELMRNLDFLDTNSYRSGRIRLDWVLGLGWLPIGTSEAPLRNRLLGNGHAIRNLTINRPDRDEVGLFAVNAGEIRDIRLLDVNIHGRSTVGALVAVNDPGIFSDARFSRGVIRNSSVNGSIRGVSQVGALVGINGADPTTRIDNSSATGIVIGTGSKVGGLVGQNSSIIINSQAFSTVSGINDVGGLVGASEQVSSINNHTINSHATGNVTGFDNVGGLIGGTRFVFIIGSLIVTNSYATGNVEGQGRVGGLVGFVVRGGVRIDQSHATGNVTGGGNVGGLVGRSEENASIDDSYATGNVVGGIDVGGLIGRSLDSNVTNNYAVGNVQGGLRSQHIGGFIGRSEGGSIANSHAIGNVRAGQASLRVGGFIGRSVGGSITNNHAIGNVRAGQASLRVGGFIGGSEGGGIADSYATGIVKGDSFIGGFIGRSVGGSIINSHAIGNVEGGTSIGGFIGENINTSIADSYATGDVQGAGTPASGFQVGGFIGRGSGSITRSYASGNVEGDENVGGFIGVGPGSITNSYVMGSVRGNRIVGGFVGLGTGGNITNSYAIGNVRGNQLIGGFMGFNNGFVAITNSYWDESTSSIMDSVGGEGKTTVELQSPIEAGSTQTETYYNWDEQVWDFGTSEQYPALKYSDGTLQPGQRLGLLRLGLPSGLIVSPSFKPEVLSYRVIDETDIRRISMAPVAANSDGNIIIESGGITGSTISLNTAGVTIATVEVRTPYNPPIQYKLAFNDRTFNEGERIILQRITSQGVNESALRYQWTQLPGMPRLLPMEGISQAVLDVPISEAALSETEDDSEITIRLEINDGIPKDLRLTIVKTDNGTVLQTNPIITRSDRTLTAPTVDLSTDPDGAGTINSYLWQRRVDINADWIDIEGANTNTYRVPEDTASYTEYRVRYSYTDGQGYTQTLISEVLIFIKDVDIDDNGLIEISDLEGLDAIRYQLDGSGYRQSETASKITEGCPDEGCRGYELTRSLDFEQGASYRSGIIRAAWTTGSGWLPIGTSEAPFDATFNANGHTIANLRIDRGDAARGVGLFGITASNAKIENVGLLDVDILGNQGVGGLVGYKQGGSIASSYVTGQVRGNGDYDVGGLVGWHRGGTISGSSSTIVVVGSRRNVGGLVGDNDGGTITDSYARGSVDGVEKVGGLVGRNSNTSNMGIIMRSRAEVKVNGDEAAGGLVGENSGIITNSYSRERIIGMADVGGFVGWNSGDITNSYALGFVKGNNEVGGFVGNNLAGTITNSYARGNVEGANRYIGGLVGWSARGAIINSYAQGNVSGKDGVGGLVGVNLGLTNNRNIGRVSKSYATGRVRGDTNTGGLIGENRDGHVEESYWNKTNNPTVVSAGGTSKTSVEMQTPTQPGNNATEIYYDWNIADWDFGGTDQYPTLKYAIGPDQSQPACGTAGDRDCGTALDGQHEMVRIAASIELIADISLLTEVVKELNVVLNVGIGDGSTNLKTRVRSSNLDIATVSIAEEGDLIRTLRIETGSDIGRSEITVLVDDGEGSADSISSTTFVVTTKVNSAPQIRIASLSELISVGEKIVIPVAVMDDDFEGGDRVFLTSSVVPEVLVGPRQIVGINSNKTERITLRGVRGGTAMIKFTATDSKGATHSVTLSVLVDAQPTGSVRINFTDEWLLRATSTIADANDIVRVDYQWYRNGVAIARATSRTYMIPDNRGGRATGVAYSLELTVVDSIGQSVATQSNSLVVANEPPVITGITAAEMISEGDTQNISVNASDPNYDDLMYRWSGDFGVLSNEHSNPATLSIPSDYIQDPTATQATLNLEVEVNDEELATTTAVLVVVRKENNGSARLTTSIEIGSRETTLTAIVSSTDPDAGTSGIVVYQWQVCAGVEGLCPSANDWMNIDEARETQYIISGADILLEDDSRLPLVVGGSLFRVEGTYTDGQGYGEKVHSPGYSYSGRVNASPTISGLPVRRVRLLKGTETEFNVVLNDADVDDLSDTLVFDIQSDTPEVARLSVEGDGTTRTIKITAIGIGMATITATVNDGRGVSNSEVLERFEVEVEGNEAPMLEVIAYPQELIGLGNTTQVVVVVSDNNFDVGDNVVVEAMSSNPSMVSVIPMQTDPITTDTRITFMLIAEQSGAATITFTATDSQNVSTNTEVMVRVNTPPHVLPDNVPSQVMATVGEAFELKTSEFFADVDGDLLRYRVVGLPASIVITTTGTLVGVPVIGDASKNRAGLMVTVFADDGREGSTQTTFVLLIDAKPTASVRVDPNDKWQLTAMVEDANGIVGVNYQWYRNGVAIANDANNQSYTIPDNRAGRAAGISYSVELTIMDSIGQSVVIQTDSYTIANEPPVITSITAAEMISEGDTQDIRVSASDPNYDDLVYRWNGDLELLSNENSNPATLSIPADYIKDATSMQTTLNLMVEVSDGILSTSRTLSVVIDKKNNGAATLGTSIEIVSVGTTLTTMVLSDDPDGGINGAVAYQWQVCAGNESGCPSEGDWMNIFDASEAQYMISGADIVLEGGSTFRLVEGGSLFRAQGTYSDGQGYDEEVYSQGYSYSTRVNASPTVSGIPLQQVRLLEGTATEFVVELSDADTDDISSNLVFGVQSDKLEVARVSVEGEGTTRTIKITGVSGGIATITATVNDGRGVSNSAISEQFEVEVEANEAPMLKFVDLKAIGTPRRIIEQGNTTQVMVLISDNNFDVDDSVVLEAMSSSRPIVSVIPTQPDTITADVSRTFALNGIKAGIATIVFTATDRSGSTDSVSLLVSVDAQPTGSVRIDPNDKWLLTAIVADANGIVGVNYQWSRNGVAIPNATSPTYTIPDNRLGRTAGTSYSVELTVLDSIGQSVVIQSNSHTIANERPVITVPVAEMISEGNTQDINVNASDPNHDDLTYRWSGDSEVLSNKNSNPARLSIPPYYIKDAVSDQTTLNLEVAVSDGDLTTTSTVSVVVNKRDNGSARLGAALDFINGDAAIMAPVSVDDPDGGISRAEYQWQVCASNDGPCSSANAWLNIDEATKAQYIVSGSSILLENGNRFQIVQNGSVFRALVTYTDGQGYRAVIDSPGYTHFLRVNNSPTISGLPSERIGLLEKTETEFVVELSDADADDISSELAFGIQSDKPEVARVSVEGEGTTRTIKITGIGAGITTVTMTVNDGRNVSNSRVSEQFRVEVEGNEAPVLKITSVEKPVIGLGNTTQVVVLVSDSNFDVGDSMVLEAMSSSQSIVSVTPTQTGTITSDTSITFRLSGVNTGEVVITFIATDSKGLRSNVSLLVRVSERPNDSVSITSHDTNKWLLRATSMIADASDVVGVGYQWYRNGVAIARATSRTYMILDNRIGRAAGISYSLNLIIMDNIGQSVVIPSNSFVVANERPVITGITAVEMISEGDMQTIRVSASDANYDDLMYRWSGASGIFNNEHSNPATLSIPTNYIQDPTATQATLSLEVEVNDGDIATTRMLSVIVEKENNGSARLRTSIEIGSRGTTLTAIVLSDDPDAGTGENVRYQWQVCAGNQEGCPSANDWMNIDEATGTQYITSGADIMVEGGSTFPLIEDGSLFRVEGVYSDGQGYGEEVYSPGYSYSTRVNASPTISGIPVRRIRLLEGTETEFGVVLNDADDDDLSDDLLLSIESDTLEVVRVNVEGDSATRTIKITAIGAGIATITATLNDGRGVSNSEVSEQFEVEVEGNEAPMLEVIAYPQELIKLGNTTQVVVLVSDNNFDFGDSVVVGAMSSSQSMVSVIPMQTNPITTDTRITFMLTAKQSGEATIMFIATDSQNVTTDTQVVVRVNTPPHVLSDNVPSQVVATVGEAFELEISEFFADVDGDLLRYEAVGLPASIVITTTGTLVGVPMIGDASKNRAGLMVTVSADDGRGGSTQTAFVLLIDAKPTASVHIDPNDKWQLTAMAEDANGIVGVNYQWYRNGVAIANAMNQSYTIPDNRAGRASGISYSVELTIMDSIGQSVVIQTDSHTIANESPVISVPVAEMIDEGDTRDISVSASDPNHDDLTYRWVGDLELLSNERSNPATLSIPPDYIKDVASMQTTLNLMVEVSDGILSTSRTVSVVVDKKNNGSATLGTSIEIVSVGTTLTTMVLSDDPDGGINGAVAYQWQVCAGNESGCPSESDWMNIIEATGTQYMISGSSILVESGSRFALVEGGSLFRARGTYIDGQDYDEAVYSQGYSYSRRVNVSPTVSGIPLQQVRLLEGTATEFVVELGDADADDLSSDLVFGIQSDKSEVARVDVEGEGTTRTIKITSISAGIATITAMVNDGRGVSNSEISEQFEVEVEANEAPVLEIITSSTQIIEQGNTTQVMVLISDNNFDVGDSVVLEAMSSDQSIVSVIPEETDSVAMDRSVIFTLNGIKAGIATIVFTATDSRGSTDSVSLLVSVDAKPTGSVRIGPDSGDKWLLRAISTIADANGIVKMDYQWYRSGVAIPNATSQTYTIPDNRLGRAVGTSYSVELTVLDSIGQLVVIQSDSHTIANERPVIIVPVAEMISEGNTQDIRVTASDPNHDDLAYRWNGDFQVLSNENSNPARLSIPPYYIKDTVADQTTLNLVVEVSDGDLATTRTVSVVVNKRDNGFVRLGLSLDFINGDTAIMTPITIDDPDGGISRAEYQWQVCAANDGPCFLENAWMNIDGANKAQYIVSGSSIAVEGGSRFQIIRNSSVFRALVTYTDAQGYRVVIDSLGYTLDSRVNNSPTISGLPVGRIRLLEGAETEFVVELSDADADDISGNLAFGIQSDKPEVARVSAEGEGTTRTIKITGINVGITTVTMTVNDGRNVSNSKVSEQFKLEVEGNEAPVLKITSVAQPTIGMGNTTQVVVLVSDNNFDVNDSVVVGAMSLRQSIVSVIPTQTGTITTDTSVIFTLNVIKAGIATIVFTAMDSRGSTDSVSLLVRVNAKPIGSVRIVADNSNKWLLRATAMIEDTSDVVEMNYQWYRDGVAIPNATSQTYMIPGNREGRASGTSYSLELTVVDNIGQSVVIRSNAIAVANEPPVITSITAAEMISEGDMQVISVNASDPNHDDLMYRWSGDDSDVLSNENSNPATLSIPPYYIRDAVSDQTTLNLEVEVDDGELPTTRALLVQVNKKNNGSARLRTSIEIASGGTTLTAIVLSADPDGGTSGTVVYQWQVCAGEEGRCPSESHWMNIDGATTAQYVISGTNIMVKNGSVFSLMEDGSLFRIRGTYTDGQGYNEEVDSEERLYTTLSVLRIRAKVFLEGPLQ